MTLLNTAVTDVAEVLIQPGHHKSALPGARDGAARAAR